ncbi:MAG: hypothetical protein K2X87_22995 [Gemmataceae bacterium]|nr:hypothetical protein [Gemmataceae bacterium]
MATLKKITTTRWLDEAGNRVLPDTPGASKVREESAKWYIVTKEDGKLKRIPAYTDKSARLC